MTTPRRRIAMALGLVLALVVTVGIAPVAAHGGGNGGTTKPLPTRIDLPDGFAPEGIESGWNGRLYAGSLVDGAIWTGSPKTGKGKILVPGVAGRVAVGLHLDGRGRLWVAGGPTQTIRVYRAATGKLLKTYTFPTAGFINDLDITRNAVYATDSLNQQLLVVPLGKWGKLPRASAAKTKALTGAIDFIDGFNANGIAAKDGWLLLVQSNTGFLFRVNPKTGFTRRIDLGTYLVSNGDGLEVFGKTLYVVRNQDNLVAVFRLGKLLRSARLLGEITSPDLDVPTTATRTKHGLYVVNARFGTAPTPTTEYWITKLPTRP
jgi:hypothetical protein